MPPMVLVEGTMMPFEAKEVILGSLETGENELRCDVQAFLPFLSSLLGTFNSPSILPLFLSPRMVRGDPRAIVEYRDLDAPDDVDFF